MIEYVDKQFGKIKVLNVTEARANFATVLGDRKAHYIITKNNKPLRVIIAYDDYESLKERAAGSVHKPSDSHQTTDAIAKPKPSTKSTATKGRVKGLLESNDLYLQQAADKKTPPQPQAQVVNANFAPEPRIEPVLPKPAEVEPKFVAKKPIEPKVQDLIVEIDQNADDYFNESDDFETDDLLVTPDAMSVTEELITTAEVEPKAEPVAEPTQPPASTAVDDDGRTEEEREYFKKYQALYAKMGMGLEEAQDETPNMQGIDDVLVTKEPDEEIVQPAKTKVTKEQKARVIEDFDFDSESTVLQDEAESQSPRPPQPQPEPEGGLPSLKDLLKDLESETLTGEDEELALDDREIDDLINRITQD